MARTVSLQGFLKDFKAGLGDAELMERHGLSPRQLELVLQKAVEKGRLSEAEVSARRSMPAPIVPSRRGATPAPAVPTGSTTGGQRAVRSVETGASVQDRFSHTTYLIRKKILKIFGGAFHIYDPAGELVFYSRMKAFKLKEDIRVFTGEDMQTEILVIKARKILDFSSAYDVWDSRSDEKVGVLKRKGLVSLARDEWIIMDPSDREIGILQEDSLFLALLRRLIGLIPQRYHARIQGRPVCSYQQNWNPFVLKITVDFSDDVERLFDKRLGIASAVLLSAIEGRQG
ncbi:MAG: hypothetical protein AB1646_04600 [Thermodesulfobacteriota bacterium]